MDRSNMLRGILLVSILIVSTLLLTHYFQNGSMQRIRGMLTRAPTPKTITFIDKTYRLAKRIKLIKNTTGVEPPADAQSDWRAMYIAIVDVRGDNEFRYPASAFSSVTMSSTLDAEHSASNVLDGNPNTFAATAANDSIATLTLTLKDESWVETINILSRPENKMQSLVGVKVVLEDITGAPIWIGTCVKPGGESLKITSQLPPPK